MADELVVAIGTTFPSGAVVAADFRAALAGGSVLTLFGPSGAGKTTVLRAIAGLARPDRGRIALGGETWFDERTWVEPQARRVGYVSQTPALFPHVTVKENVEFWKHGAARGGPATDDLLGLVELGGFGARRPRELSGGQAQRVALARAMAAGPRLLLLDEPFAGLDEPTRVRLRGLLRALVDRLGIPAVLVTHDRTDAIAMGGEMAVLADGGIRQLAPVADVFRRPADLVVARSVGVESVLPARIERVRDGLVDVRVADTIVLRAAETGGEAAGAEVFACIRAEDVVLEHVASATASARNHLPGQVVRIDSDGHVERVTVDCGLPLVAIITRHAREEMALAPHTPIVAAIKATAIHLVGR